MTKNAWEALTATDYAQALRAFEDQLKQTHDDELAALGQLVCLCILKDLQGLQEHAQRILARPTASSMARDLVAHVYARFDFWRPALALLEAAPGNQVRSEVAYEALIRCHRIRHEYAYAQATIDEASTHYPKSVPIRLEQVRLWKTQHQVDQALALLDEMAAEPPTFTAPTPLQHMRMVLISARPTTRPLAPHIWQLRISCHLRKRDFASAEAAATAARQALPKSPRVLIELARTFREQERYTDALDSLDLALTRDPSNETALAEQVICQRRQGQLTVAEHSLNQALALRPQSIRLQLQQGWLCADQELYESAIVAFVKVQAIDPDREGACNGLTIMYRRQKDWAAAHTEVNRGLEQIPKSPLLRNQLAWVYNDQECYEEALQAFARTLEIAPYNEQALATSASLHRKLKQYPAAQVAVERGLALLPQSPLLLNQQAWIHATQEYHQKALQAFAKTLEVAPRNEKALEWTVNLHRRLKDFRAAQVAVERGLALLPNSPLLRNEQAWVYANQEEHDQALQAFAKTLEVAPRNERALEWTTICHRRLKNLPAALHSAQEAVVQVPDSVRLQLSCALLFYQQKSYRNALRHFASTLELEPKHEIASAASITCYRLIREHQAAQKAADRALDLLPDSTMVLNEQGWIHVDRKLYDEALRYFEHTLRLDERNESALKWSVICLRRQKKLEQAQTIIGRALATNPDSPELLRQQAWVHYERERYADAVHVFKSILETTTDDERTFESAAVCHRKLRNFTAAQDTLLKGLQACPASVLLHNEQAFLEYEQRRHTAALAHCEQALQLDPANEVAHATGAACLRQLEDYGSAQARLDKALGLIPNSPLLLNEQARLHLDQRQYAKALERFTEVLRINDDDEEALAGTVTCFRHQHQYMAALEAAKHGLHLCPDSVSLRLESAELAIARGTFEVALSEFEEVLVLEPLNEQALTGKLRALRREQGRAIDLAHAQNAAPHAPHSAHVLTECAKHHLLQGEPHSAERLLQQARDQAGSWFPPTQDQARLLQQQGRPHEGLAVICDFRKAYPFVEQAAFEHGRLLIAMHQTSEAEQVFLALKKRNPHSILGLAGEAMVRYEQGYHDEAANLFETLAAEHPEYAVSQAMAIVRGNANDTEALESALQLCNTALGRSPLNVAALTCRAAVYYHKGDWHFSEADLRRATSLDPLSGPWRDLGSLYVKQSRSEEAETLLRRAIELNGFDTQAHIELGGLLFEVDRKREGLSALRRACAIDPTNPAAVTALAQGLLMFGEASLAERELLAAKPRISPRDRLQLYLWLARTQLKLAAATDDELLLREALGAANAAVRLHPSAPEGYFEQGMARAALGDHHKALESFKAALKYDSRHLEAQRNYQRLKGLLRQQNSWRLADFTGYAFSLFSFLMLGFIWYLYLNPPETTPNAAAQARPSNPPTAQTTASPAGATAREGTGEATAEPGPTATPPNRTPPPAPPQLQAQVALGRSADGQSTLRFASTQPSKKDEPPITATMLLTFTPMFSGLMIIGLLLPLLTRLKLPGMEAELQQQRTSIASGPSGQAGQPTLSDASPALSMPTTSTISSTSIDIAYRFDSIGAVPP